MLIEVCNKVTPPCYGGAAAGPGKSIAPADKRTRISNRDNV